MYIHLSTPIWAVLPFLLLLGMIATGPVLYPELWHRYYPLIAPMLGAGVMGYYLLLRGDWVAPVETLAEYVQFIALIAALYMASHGIMIDLKATATPSINLALLWSGAILSNLIGTTGVSMLLIRPYIRLNGSRIRAYHIIFFIFMVSNLGGALTCIGDPPLFLGFLKGVPFLWTLQHHTLPWIAALVLLSIAFYGVDRLKGSPPDEGASILFSLSLSGKRNLIWILIILGAVFLDPKILPALPAISYHGHQISFIRELILLGVAFFSYRMTDKKILRENGFSFEPLKEVVCIFMGIFGTMIPALALIKELAQSPLGQKAINPATLYWSTGILSSLLDNAPTYLNFLAAGMASKGLSIDKVQDVLTYAGSCIPCLKATSLAAVFFGAMTYIGNGPNFMVKAIADKEKVKMPSFGSYILYYSLPILAPILLIIGVLFI